MYEIKDYLYNLFNHKKSQWNANDHDVIFYTIFNLMG